MRTTRKQIESQFACTVAAARAKGIDVANWRLDNAPAYGGYEITYTVGESTAEGVIGGIMNRMAPSAFYAALRVAEGILTH